MTDNIWERARAAALASRTGPQVSPVDRWARDQVRLILGDQISAAECSRRAFELVGDYSEAERHQALRDRLTQMSDLVESGMFDQVQLPGHSAYASPYDRRPTVPKIGREL